MDGRDIGTVVLPNAQIKLFLTASVACRAQRRYEELIAKGMEVTLEDVQSDMEKRDYADSHRAVAPLKPAEDAQIVDTSWLELHQSVALLTEIITRRLNG
jgi:cytidylate kinase